MNPKDTLIAHQKEWNKVIQELESENVKLASYDQTLLPLLGNVKGKKILDYGSGPGVLAMGLARLGADVKVWDINADMREKAALRIGNENVFQTLEDIPRGYADFIICNLVFCIVPEDEVRAILKNMASMLNNEGEVFIGFCNPRIFEIAETQLDFRFPEGKRYEENHNYKKIKKEGGYQIIESHRPVEWYEKVFSNAGLTLVHEHFTPEYELKGNRIRDFIIFQLAKS